MKKTTWKYLVDTLLFISITGIAFIGILMAFFLAEGPTSQARESEKYFLSLHRHQWGDIHLYLSLAFTALVVIHLILEWSWIKGETRQLFKKAWVPILVFMTLMIFGKLMHKNFIAKAKTPRFLAGVSTEELSRRL